MRLYELSPGCREQTLAGMVGGKDILDVCSAMLTETVLGKLCIENVEKVEAIHPEMKIFCHIPIRTN